MQSIPFKSIGFLIAAATVYALQLAPIPGVFLMMLGGPVLTGALIDAFFISLFLEASRGDVPSWLVIVPLLAVGAYYGLYFQQTWEFHQKNAALLAQNPKLVLRFDPATQSLVDDLPLEEKYALPIVYQHWGAEGEYRARRLLPYERCNIRPDARAGVFVIEYPKAPNGQRSLCVMTMKEKPYKSVVEVRRVSNDPHHLRPEREETVEIRVDGALRASFKTLRTEQLWPLPLYAAGCGLDSGAPAWRCFRQFMTLPVILDGYDTHISDFKKDRPEEVMLGLRRYSDEELNNYQGHPESEPFAR